MIDYSKFKTKQYIEAKPYPHLVVDNLFNVSFMNSVLAEFPKKEKIKWWKYDNVFEKKLAYDNIDQLNTPNIKKYFDLVNSREFCIHLEKLTKIKDILPDHSLYGGGLHRIEAGGKLDIHADFQFHKITGQIRKLNVITYLNKNWQEEYKGHLELWDSNMTKCIKKILPIFNRTVIFYIDEYSFHGHPDILKCPPGMSRKSLATYYYIENKQKKESEIKSTSYKRRPTDPYDHNIEKLREKRRKGRL